MAGMQTGRALCIEREMGRWENLGCEQRWERDWMVKGLGEIIWKGRNMGMPWRDERELWDGKSVVQGWVMLWGLGKPGELRSWWEKWWEKYGRECWLWVKQLEWERLGLKVAGEFELWDSLRGLGPQMLGIGTPWEAEESGLGRAEEKPLSLGAASTWVGLSFWKRGDFRMASNRHHPVLGCRQRPDLMLAPRRLSYVFLLS